MITILKYVSVGLSIIAVATCSVANKHKAAIHKGRQHHVKKVIKAAVPTPQPTPSPIIIILAPTPHPLPPIPPPPFKRKPVPGFTPVEEWPK